MVVVQVKSVFLWTFITLQLIASTSAKLRYDIMIDAGSRGSRLHIYSSVDGNGDGVLEVSEVSQVEVRTDTVRPGLASFADRPGDIEAYLQPLLDAAQEAIPADHHHTTEIFLMGTAGMRLLSEQDADVVIEEVVQLFSDQRKCPFRFKPDNAKIITGKWEGIYTWITVNFLQGVFIPQSRETYGIVNLSEESLQNVFINQNDRAEHESLTLGGREYEVVARSYLEYGQNKATKRFQKRLVDSSGCSNSEAGCEIENPCQFKGYEEVNDLDGVSYKFIGSAKTEECRSIIQDITLSLSHDQPPLMGRFYGIGDILYILHGIKMLKNTDTVTPQEVGSAAESYCHLSYKDHARKDRYAHKNCFGANYIFELFKDGYKLRENEKITVKSSLNGFKLGWTLGALLYNTEIL